MVHFRGIVQRNRTASLFGECATLSATKLTNKSHLSHLAEHVFKYFHEPIPATEPDSDGFADPPAMDEDEEETLRLLLDDVDEF